MSKTNGNPVKDLPKAPPAPGLGAQIRTVAQVGVDPNGTVQMRFGNKQDLMELEAVLHQAYLTAIELRVKAGTKRPGHTLSPLVDPNTGKRIVK